MFGGGLTPEQMQEAMAETQKLMGQHSTSADIVYLSVYRFGFDPNTMGDLGTLGAVPGSDDVEVELLD